MFCGLFWDCSLRLLTETAAIVWIKVLVCVLKVPEGNFGIYRLMKIEGKEVSLLFQVQLFYLYVISVISPDIG